jgi:hypothetical protein
MNKGSKEYYDMLAQFEKDCSYFNIRRGRFDKETNPNIPPTQIYQDGQINDLFLAWRAGYSNAKSIYDK